MRLLIAAVIVLVPHLAFASSDAAWAGLFAKAATACRQASGLKQAIAGPPIVFSNHVLVVVAGRWPQPHMKGRRATFVCLYDKRSGTAEAQEAPHFRK